MELKELFNKYNIEINNENTNKFNIYYEKLINTNKLYNLTAITEKNEVFIKHFLDSVIIINKLKNNSKLLDIGTGAGFPGLPIKILRDDLDITLLDSLNKRIYFLNDLIINLKLNNIKAVHARAEDYIIKNRGKFDIVVSRAVAKLPILLEYVLPYLKIGGKAYLYKSVGLEEEIEISKYALDILGGKILNIYSYNLENNIRKIIEIEKIKETPINYPRGKNLPKDKPLIKN